ncbi:cysteine protease family C48, putative [Phytophthora infestans T30-4]|uniref:Cysteine protease family C48, putative n=1 Tax=Phytophthora infestans (strain T30-4) TaxID=403677 RepID=D0NMM6_PHYIT|nr:cysteine protease family C48, putative [Phytophthora infestans T30-4]EEY61783.1 cysteine protease family C48, putative [Phytophthora infestans T30-4]|eukprot:XP_002899423.1 cysteine protease family C48, putative [Phytophthora infestans T30-4]
MKDQCEQGVKFCTWLLQNVISTIPSVQHPVLENMVNQVAKSNPQSTIVIEVTECHYAMLYRLNPPSWANDALIHAFCTRLCATNPTARVPGIESTVTGRNAKGMNESLKKKAQELVGEADLLMIPVNVGNSHWCGIAVDVKRARVLYYDSMNQRTYKTVLDRLSWDLAKTLSDDYEVVSINAPTQTDGHNCGFFVMLRLWRMVDNSSALDRASLKRLEVSEGSQVVWRVAPPLSQRCKRKHSSDVHKIQSSDDSSRAVKMAQRSIQIGVRGSAQVTELMGAGTPSQWLAATGWE